MNRFLNVMLTVWILFYFCFDFSDQVSQWIKDFFYEMSITSESLVSCQFNLKYSKLENKQDIVKTAEKDFQ